MKKNYLMKTFRESATILILAAILRSIGGLGIQGINEKLVSVMPLLILLPALNAVVGNFGGITSSRFTTLLYLGVVKKSNWHKSSRVKKLFKEIIAGAFITAVYMSLVACAFSALRGYQLSSETFLKVAALVITSVLVLSTTIFFVAVLGGLIIHNYGHDPDNYLIPMTTSIGDLGSMIMLTVLTVILF
jgi:cation transporter-like permease